MFLGEDTHTLDTKGRIVMPSRFRDDLSSGCIVLKGQDGHLMIYPSEVWRERAAEIMQQPQNRAGRRFSRTFFSGADEQQLDKSGRLLIKPDLREFAGLEPGADVAVLGVYDHVELWNRDSYETERELGDELYVTEEEMTESTSG